MKYLVMLGLLTLVGCGPRPSADADAGRSDAAVVTTPVQIVPTPIVPTPVDAGTPLPDAHAEQ